MAKEMTLLEHFEELRTRVIRSLLGVTIITVFTVAFSMREVNVNGFLVWLPYPDPFSNIGVQAIERIQLDVVPPCTPELCIKLIQFQPGQAFFAAIFVALFLGVLFSMPIIVHEASGFIGPGLYPHEKRMITRLVIPATLLFAAGAAFAYLYVAPFAFRFLYSFGASFQPGIEQFVEIMALVTFTLQFVLAFGLAFQLPIFMWVITRLGLVQANFWRRNFRYALVAIVIFGAIITPDGSGITMWFVALPMLALYAGGYLATKRLRVASPLMSESLSKSQVA
jgi:sec-independent protein translocase protein TatC